LESSKVQHVTLKMFRDKKANSDKVDYHKGGSFREKLHMFKEVTIACIAQIERA